MYRKILFFAILILNILFSSWAFAKDIRVALVVGQATAEISSEDGFIVEGTFGSEKMPGGKYFLHQKSGQLIFDEKHSFSGSLVIKPLDNKPLPLVNRRGGYGTYRVLAAQDKLTIVDQLDLEKYLDCVLPQKTMPIWPDEVIKAQAIAARTYALYHSVRNSADNYDLKAVDEELKFYDVGPKVEQKYISKIIKQTEGEYVKDSYNRPIYALTTSSTGGRTEAVEGYSYLVSQKDFDEESPDFEWEKRISPFIVLNLLEQQGYKLGKLDTICLSPMKKPSLDRTATGRVEYMVFVGGMGSAKVEGAELARLLDLPSNLFDIRTGIPMPETLKVPIENSWGMVMGSKEITIKVKDNDKPVIKTSVDSYHMVGEGKEEKITFKGFGKGSGHGLSAWGARGQYNKDPEHTTYADILNYYYPGTHL